MNSLDVRRQAAHEAAEIADPESRVTAAIEIATRVRITPELIRRVQQELAWTDNDDPASVRALIAALLAGEGFEVVTDD